MKHLTEQQEIEKVTYIYKVKEKLNNYLGSNKTAEEIKEEITNMCLNCFLPINPDCEICLGNCNTKDELQMILEFPNLCKKCDRDVDGDCEEC